MSSVLKVDEIQNTAGTSALTIDSSGVIKRPVIPFGQAATGGSPITSGNKITLDSSIISGGGLTVDTTNERMIVPVAGLYRIGFNHLTNNLTGTVGVEMRKNGTRIDGSRTQVKGQTYVGLTVHMLASLAVNDYIEWWVDTGTVHNNSTYNSMYVYLVG